MGATLPHIAVVLYEAKQGTALGRGLGALKIKDPLDLLWVRFDALASDNVAKVRNLR